MVCKEQHSPPLKQDTLRPDEDVGSKGLSAVGERSPGPSHHQGIVCLRDGIGSSIQGLPHAQASASPLSAHSIPKIPQDLEEPSVSLSIPVNPHNQVIVFPTGWLTLSRIFSQQSKDCELEQPFFLTAGG